MIAVGAEDGFGGARRKKSVYPIGMIISRDLYPKTSFCLALIIRVFIVNLNLNRSNFETNRRLINKYNFLSTLKQT